MGLSGYGPAPMVAGPPPAALGPWTGPPVHARPVGGMAGTVPGLGFGTSALAAIGPVEVGSAFPAASYTFDPSAPAAAQQQSNGWLVDFVTRSVVRPFVRIPNLGWEYNPGAGAPDYSGVAGAVLIGAVGVGVGTAAWLLARALVPTRMIARGAA